MSKLTPYRDVSVSKSQSFKYFSATNQYLNEMMVTESPADSVFVLPAEETKPDYHARKSCNFLTATTQVFGLGDNFWSRCLY